MKPQEFSEYIKHEVILDIASNYEQIFNSPLSDFTDTKWIKIKKAYDSMDASQKEAMHAYALQAMIDAASNILGILDGTSILSRHREEFSLMYGNDAQPINGNLQDYFLNAMNRQ